MTAAFVIEPLGGSHDRAGFQCGADALNGYFRNQASQDIRRKVTSCYVAVEPETGKVAGFYTLAAGGIPLADMPAQLKKMLPRYPSVPIARLGRLAVDREYHGRHLGGALLWDAIARASRSELAVFAMAVDAKDDQAISFYQHHGFVVFGSLSNQLILPLGGQLPSH